MLPIEDPHVWSATLAAQFAQEIGLPPGNLWEPGIARTLYDMVRLSGYTRHAAEYEMRGRLGLRRAP